MQLCLPVSHNAPGGKLLGPIPPKKVPSGRHDGFDFLPSNPVASGLLRAGWTAAISLTSTCRVLFHTTAVEWSVSPPSGLTRETNATCFHTGRSKQLVRLIRPCCTPTSNDLVRNVGMMFLTVVVVFTCCCCCWAAVVMEALGRIRVVDVGMPLSQCNCFDRISSGLRYVCDWIVAVIQNRFVE